MKQLGVTAQIRLLAQLALDQIPGGLTSERDRLRDVQRVVRAAYRDTQFYRAKFEEAGLHPKDIRTWSDFMKIPTTTKDELIAAGASARTLRRVHNLHISRSSGSSGRFLDVYADDSFWIRDSVIIIDVYRRQIGLRMRDQQLYANTSEYPYRSVGGFGYRVSYFDNLRPVRELAEWLYSQRPAVLLVYPSIAIELRDLLLRCGRDPASDLRLKAIITHSEQSAQSLRDGLATFFGCPVYDQYATEELGWVAVQCRYHTYHVIEAECHLEVLAPDSDTQVATGEPGEIVGTSLLNNKMPFIRYRQGDLATLTTVDCPCGRKRSQALGQLLGRANSSFLLPGGQRIASGRLLDWTYHLILDGRLDIRQFQLVQTNLDRVKLLLVVGLSYRAERDEQVIHSSFRQLLTDEVDVDVQTVAHIPKTAAGKHLPIRSELSMDAVRSPGLAAGTGNE